MTMPPAVNASDAALCNMAACHCTRAPEGGRGGAFRCKRIKVS